MDLKINKSSTLTIILMMICFNSFGQAPDIEWQNTIGGNEFDACKGIVETPDGYFLGSLSYSGISGDKTDVSNGLSDYWLLKLNKEGVIQWQNSYGGDGYDHLYTLGYCNDGGLILGGSSSSTISGDKTVSSLGQDYWLIKIDSIGNIQWQNSIGGSGSEQPYSVFQTSDGGFIIGGDSYSGISGDKTQASRGDNDYWVVKTDASGNIEWDKTFGGSSVDFLHGIAQAADGGYFLCGESYSVISGDKTENKMGLNDIWIIKLNAFGVQEWQNTIGGNKDDYGASVVATVDNGCVIGGHSGSSMYGDKTEANHGPVGTYDFWILKLDEFGNIEWQNTIGGSGDEYLHVISKTADSGFILGGSSTSGISGDKTEAGFGESDYWIVKLDAAGLLIWDKTIGGNESEGVRAMIETSDYGFMVCGNSESIISGDKTEVCIGEDDNWILKLEGICEAVVELCNTLDDNCNGLIDDDINYIINISAAGSTSFCQGNSVILSATTTGPNFQWKKNGTNIPGATSTTYNVTTKGNYSCVTTSACDTVESTPIFVNVIKNPNASISAGGPTTFCAGGSVILTEVAVAGCTYQWYKGATPIAGATALTYTATTSGNYKCRVTKAATGCYKNSNAIAVSVPCREEDPTNNSIINVYPNPATSSVFISINQLTNCNSQLTIADCTGKIITSFENVSSSSEIDISFYPVGMYFITIRVNDEIETVKFMKIN